MIQRLAAGCVLLTGSVLMAQNASEIQDVEPSWVTVSSSAVSLKSGSLVQLYSVAELAQGTVLRLNGQSDEWARVIYPDSIFPFVRVSDARDLGNDRIVLINASQLLAPNRMIGLAGSWRSVYRTAMPAGTQFEIMGRETNTDGDVTAYAVRPTHGETLGALPLGFLSKDSVRASTAEEIQAHLAKAGKATAVTDPAEQPAETPGDPAVDEIDDSANEVDTSLLNPIITTPPVESGAEEDENTGESGSESDVEAPPATDNAADGGPDVIEQTEVGTVEDDAYADEYGIRPARLIELEDAFNEARVLPRLELDGALEELMAEYQRAIEATDEPSVQRALQSRIGWLEIRMDSRDKRLELNAFLNKADDARVKNAEMVEQWQSGRSFDLVGRVLLSRVYDGNRLPKMYRLVGEDPLTGPRTLGYIADDGGEFDAALFVGQVVGIRGHIELNPESKLKVVKVDQFTVMPE